MLPSTMPHSLQNQLDLVALGARHHAPAAVHTHCGFVRNDREQVKDGIHAVHGSGIRSSPRFLLTAGFRLEHEVVDRRQMRRNTRS